jgi:hypothetical protein
MADEKRTKQTVIDCRATIEATKRKVESSLRLLRQIEEQQASQASRPKRG